MQTHRNSELTIVLEYGLVTTEFDTPTYNLLGFEYAPETPLQKAAVKQAELQFSRPEALFAFNSDARCVSQSMPTEISFFDADTHDEEDEHHDDHDEDIDEVHGEADDHDESQHTDIIVSYQFNCKNFEKLSNVRVNLFKSFENC